MTQFKFTTIPSSSGGTITFTKTGLINNGEIDSSTEDLFDSEFNRIYIAYYYSNIGNPQ